MKETEKRIEEMKQIEREKAVKERELYEKYQLASTANHQNMKASFQKASDEAGEVLSKIQSKLINGSER